MLDLILCVDDDPTTLMLFKKVIAKTLFSKQIVTVQNGEEALYYFNTIKQKNYENKLKEIPQLVFLDLNMPVMGGWQFLDSFNSIDYSDFNDVKIVIISSTIDPEDLEKAKQYPMVIDFLSKPITLSIINYLKDKMSS